MDIRGEAATQLRERTKANLNGLLLLEKERRKVKEDELVFIGIAAIADYHWCAMGSLFKNKEIEPKSFGAYLEDRLLYSLELGHIDKLPDKMEEWLEIGKEITLNDVEKLLKRRAANNATWECYTSFDDQDKEIMVINPKLSLERRKFWEEEANSKGMEVANISKLSSFPKLLGEFLHFTKAEKYPKIRWNFNWHDYVVVGEADGITDNFVYEYKSVGRYLAYFSRKVVMLTQADLYGHFFGRKYKRVQVYIREYNGAKAWEEPVDEKNAVETLASLERLDKKRELPQPAELWKCKRCKYSQICPLL